MWPENPVELSEFDIFLGKQITYVCNIALTSLSQFPIQAKYLSL